MSKKYITTTLPYINADPHIGYALEVVRADIWVRYQRIWQKNDTFFNLGVDEHGLKIYQRAQELGLETQAYCDQQAVKWQELGKTLNLSEHNFIRTTDKHHIEAVQEFWRQAKNNGFIYKKNYQAKYCVGCELAKTESELVDGCCPLHPNQELQVIEEENYFFKFSEFQQPLLDLYSKNPEFVKPVHRFNEIKSFVEMGIEDFSISRLKNKMPWGVEVPGDAEHVMYVWFDALVNYISAIGWPGDTEKFAKWWPVVQLAGKDNLRQQSAMWQSMLMSAGIPNSKQIFINGFIGVSGQKMSKSLGNVISPFEMVERFGIDGTRYLILSYGNFGEDMDVSWEKFTEKYNADLANGLGNLVSRVIKLSAEVEYKRGKIEINSEFTKLINSMEFGRALEYIWDKIREDNKYIEDNKPWELAKSDLEKFGDVMQKLFWDLNIIAEHLIPFMPETAEKIKRALENKKVEPLFQRIK